jgi:hypothetical protein
MLTQEQYPEFASIEEMVAACGWDDATLAQVKIDLEMSAPRKSSEQDRFSGLAGDAKGLLHVGGLLRGEACSPLVARHRVPVNQAMAIVESTTRSFSCASINSSVSASAPRMIC